MADPSPVSVPELCIAIAIAIGIAIENPNLPGALVAADSDPDTDCDHHNGYAPVSSLIVA